MVPYIWTIKNQILALHHGKTLEFWCTYYQRNNSINNSIKCIYSCMHTKDFFQDIFINHFPNLNCHSQFSGFYYFLYQKNISKDIFPSCLSWMSYRMQEEKQEGRARTLTRVILKKSACDGAIGQWKVRATLYINSPSVIFLTTFFCQISATQGQQTLKSELTDLWRFMNISF